MAFDEGRNNDRIEGLAGREQRNNNERKAAARLNQND